MVVIVNCKQMNMNWREISTSTFAVLSLAGTTQQREAEGQ